MRAVWRMGRAGLAAGLLGLLGTPAWAAGFQEFSYGDIGGWRALHSWCDTPGRVLAVTAPAREASVLPQPVALAQWLGAKLFVQPVQLGPQDAGAGQLYTSLTPAGQAVAQTPNYYVHSSNVETVLDPSYRLTHINEYRVPSGQYRCLYAPQAAVLAATARHSVVVWERGGHLTYTSRNRDGSPGVQLTGGTHVSTALGQQYTWRSGAYTYVLEVGGPQRPGGSLSVQRAGRTVNRFKLLAYTISLPR